MVDDIPLFEIDVSVEEIRSVVDSVSRGGYWSKGPYVDEFESMLESYFDVEHAVTTNSGTTALESALVAAGVGPGDEVIVPSFTFIATANSVRLAGGEPVFADIERDTLGLDPESARDRITPDTEALLPIHPYGGPCKIRELRALADEHDLVLLEDAAEAFGATHDGDLLGRFGDVTALSFCQNKVITTGEGGAVITDDDEIARRARLHRSHGRVSDAYFESRGSGEYVELGSNYRMSDPTAAIGVGQLKRAESIIEKRRRVADQYVEALGDVDGVTPHTPPEGSRHVYQLFTVLLESGAARESVADALADEGIASKVYWDPPAHRTRYYDRGETVDLPVTDDVASRVLSLPMYTGLAESDIARIADAIADGLDRV